MFALGNHTITLHRRVPVLDGSGKPVRDAYGRKQIARVDTEVSGCDFRVTESKETETSMTATQLDGRGLLPPGTAVDYVDALTWNGIKFEVFGPVRPVAHIRTDAIDHLEISCRSYLDSSNPANREEG